MTDTAAQPHSQCRYLGLLGAADLLGPLLVGARIFWITLTTPPEKAANPVSGPLRVMWVGISPSARFSSACWCLHLAHAIARDRLVSSIRLNGMLLLFHGRPFSIGVRRYGAAPAHRKQTSALGRSAVRVGASIGRPPLLGPKLAWHPDDPLIGHLSEPPAKREVPPGCDQATRMPL